MRMRRTFTREGGDLDFSLNLEIPESCVKSGNEYFHAFIQKVIALQQGPQKQALKAFNQIEKDHIQLLQKACIEKGSVERILTVKEGDKNFSITIKVVPDNTETLTHSFHSLGEEIEKKIQYSAEETREFFNGKVQDLKGEIFDIKDLMNSLLPKQPTLKEFKMALIKEYFDAKWLEHKFAPKAYQHRSIGEAFFDLSLLSYEAGASKKKIPIETMRNWRSVHGISVLGKGGSGKTTLCQNLAYRWAKEQLSETDTDSLLLLITLRNLKKELTSIPLPEARSLHVVSGCQLTLKTEDVCPLISCA